MKKKLVTLMLIGRPDSAMTFKTSLTKPIKPKRFKRKHKRNLATIEANNKPPQYQDIIVNPKLYRPQQTYLSK